jgi:hypothetical protein
MQYYDNKKINKDQKSFLYQLIKTTENSIPREVNLIPGDENNFIEVVYCYFLTKYLSTSKAIMLLIESNYGEDAFMLLRSLWEIWIKIRFSERYEKISFLLFKVEFGRSMQKDVNRFRAVHGAHLPDNIYIDQETGTEENIKRTIEEIKLISPDIATELLNHKDKFLPGKTLYTMLKDIDNELIWFYQVAYSQPSDFLHANFGAINHYIDFEYFKGSPRVNPNGNFSVGTAYATAGMLLQILKIINNRLRLIGEEEIVKLEQRHQEVFG